MCHNIPSYGHGDGNGDGGAAAFRFPWGVALLRRAIANELNLSPFACVSILTFGRDVCTCECACIRRDQMYVHVSAKQVRVSLRGEFCAPRGVKHLHFGVFRSVRVPSVSQRVVCGVDSFRTRWWQAPWESLTRDREPTQIFTTLHAVNIPHRPGSRRIAVHTLTGHAAKLLEVNEGVLAVLPARCGAARAPHLRAGVDCTVGSTTTMFEGPDNTR